MFSSTTKSFITALSAVTLLGFATSSNALGCFRSGLAYGDVFSDTSGLVAARDYACSSFAGTYPQGGTRVFCVSVLHNRINFEARNNAGTTQTLTKDDCMAALAIEMNACSHGSEQNHGSFYYYNDPNAGACSKPFE